MPVRGSRGSVRSGTKRGTVGGGPPTSVRNAFTGIVRALCASTPAARSRRPPLRSVQCGENLGTDGQRRLRRGAGADVESDRAVNAVQLLLGEPRLCEGFGAAGLGTA